jgi:hypothetical protein
MGKNTWSFWTLPALLVLFTACTAAKTEKSGEDSPEVRLSQEDLDLTEKQYAREIVSYRASVEAGLRDNHLRIAKLYGEKPDVQGEALIVRDEKMEAMRKRNEELELRMRQYRGDNRENWKEFKREFGADMNELEKSLDQMSKPM